MGKKQKKYKPEMRLNRQNKKVKGTNIISSDTIRGCTNNCESCYSKKNCCRIIERFDLPVRVTKYIGKADDKSWYRFGTNGDPATSWKHSEKVINDLQPKNFFGVTKLQTLKGFTGIFKNLQVSVDPLNVKHFAKTLENVKTLLINYPDIRIVLRVRSCSTYSTSILELQDIAVKFANYYELPILETRVRFNRKDSIEKYNLCPNDYFMSSGKQTKPVWGKRFLVGVKKYYDCDLSGKKCKDCSNCTITWTQKQFKKKGAFIATSKSKRAYKEVA